LIGTKTVFFALGFSVLISNGVIAKRPNNPTPTNKAFLERH
jgi:hypothetical protein